MSIRGNFGITGATDQERALAGTRGGGALTRGYLNQVFAQVSTWTVAGVDTSGVHGVTIELPDGSPLPAIYTATVAPDDNDAVAAGIAAAINDADAWANVATAVAVAAVVTVTYLHPGIEYPTLSTTVQGGATIVVVDTTDAGGGVLPVATFVVNAAVLDDPNRRGCALPGPATTADQVAGIAERPHGKIESTRNFAPSAETAWPAGDSVEVVYDGPIEMHNYGTANAIAGGLVYVIRNTAGGQPLGKARSDADGGNTIVMAKSQFYWRDATPAGQRGLIFVRS